MKLRFRRSPFVLLLLALVGVALATQRIWHAPQAAKTLPAPPTLRHNTTKATSLAPPRTAAMRNDNDALSGGTFIVPQSVLPGGGRTSAGGTNSLTGSVGQAALGTASDGGRFTLFGGFWGGGSNNACPTITVAPTTLNSPVTVGTIINQAFTQTGGSGAISWTWTGTLPPSLSLNPASGVLSGTVTQTGNFAFTVRATDANGCVGERPYTLVVGTISCAITVPPTNLPNGTVGTTYAQVLNASGGLAPYTFTVVGGVLPPGLTSFSNGVLSGTPTQPGSFTFTVSVRDANNCTGTQTYTIVIGNTCPAITFTPNSLPNGAVNTPYNQIVTALPSGNYNYVVSGGLPLGLSLNPLSGAITGTPTSAGTYPFTIVATTTTGACSNSQFYTITITTQTNPCSVVLTPTSQTFSNAGGDGSVAITTGDRCVWVSLEDVSWIEILTSKSGVGSDVLRYHVSPNSGSARTGTFTISGQPFTITQSGNVAPPPPSLTCMNAAGLSSGAIAPDSLVTALGQDLSTSDQAQSAPPGVPATTLNGTTVQIRDSANTIRAPLFYVSKTQVNFLLPSATAPGPAIVTITNGAGVVAQTTVQVTTVAPGIFSANTDGRGSVQGNALRLRNGLVVAETPLARFDATQQRWVGEPLDVSRSDEQVIVQLYGTGLRARSSLANVIVTLGGIVVPVTAASPHVSAPGLDQLIFNVPPELSGRGEVSLVIGADGQAANFVTLTIK